MREVNQDECLGHRSAEERKMNAIDEPKADAKPRGFTNDGKTTSVIVNDPYGTVDPADSTGLDLDAESHVGSSDDAAAAEPTKEGPVRRR